MLSAANSNVALSTIGKDVEALGNQVVIPKDKPGDVEVTFAVDTGGGNGTLKLLYANGDVVGSRPLGYIGEGRQTVALGSAASGAEPGVHSYVVEVKNGDEAVAVESYMTGRVDGVRYSANGAVLTAGPMTIGIGHVIRVTNPKSSDE